MIRINILILTSLVFGMTLELLHSAELEIRLASFTQRDGWQVFPTADGISKTYVAPVASLSSVDFLFARPEQHSGESGLEMKIRRQPARRLQTLTKQNIGSPLVVIVDGIVISAPIIRSEIGADVFLTGFENREQAESVAKLINEKAKSRRKRAAR